MAYYVRRLPHWHPANAALFVTWRLFGSLPKRHLDDRIRLANERVRRAETPWLSGEGVASPGKIEASLEAGNMPASQEDAGRIFAQWDRQLDKASRGPLWLRDPRIAKSVVDALRFGDVELGLYELWAWVVMPNHVHVLWLPRASLSRITRSVKWFTARRANEILGRAGQPFWQDESYDHWVRDGLEREKITGYIEWNPVKAGFVEEPEQWPWSSASEGFSAIERYR